MISLVAACFYTSLPSLAYGAPSSGLVKRDGSNIKMIVPVVIVCAIAGLVLLFIFTRRGMPSRMGHWITHAAGSFGPNAGVTDGPRELTAQQLAGDEAAATAAEEQAASPRPRRTRRNRRTPSQISTRSLPAYMKEPGEHEVVIYSGPDDMEDAPTTTNIIMPPVSESPDDSIDLSTAEARLYVPMPDSPHDMPLLAGDESLSHSQADVTMDNSRTNLMPSDTQLRPSSDSISSEGGSSGSALMHAHDVFPQSQSPEVDPRGEAPPYFEVVALDDLTPSPEPPSSHDGHSPEPIPPQQTESTRRRSGFLGLFQSRASTSSRPPVPPVPDEAIPSLGHRRDRSDASAVSALSGRNRAQSRATMHRPSFSGSGSMFSNMSRSRSRLLEQQNLTSPSMISVNSISSPLSHTLVRTGFTYPKSGPTPEQLRLISSRESFARFGVPYGHDAIAFAASTSRVELPDIPPPNFDDVVGPSRSNNEATSADTTLSDDLPTNDVTTEEDSYATEVTSVGETAIESPVITTTPEALANVSPSPDAASATENTSEPSPDLASPPGLPVLLPTTESTPSSALTTPIAKKISLPSTLPPRAESRASSFTSFATAEESLHSHATPLPSPYASVSSKLAIPTVTISMSSDVESPQDGIATPSHLSTPSTPRIPQNSIHDHEATADTIVTLTPSTPASAATEIAVVAP